MKRAKMKAVDFVSLLRESILFSEHEIEVIAAECGRDRTVSGIVSACEELSITLNPEDISQLCQMEFEK